MIDPARVPPYLGALVHYRSFGTPGGECSSACRAAYVTFFGAWLDMDQDPEVRVSGGTRFRTLEQQWSPHAASLTVLNPTGFFQNERVRHRELRQPPDADLDVFPGGTWHWPCDGAR